MRKEDIQVEKLFLTLACGDYDINRGLVDGLDTIQGVDLVPLTMSSPERHWRLLRHREFDICEFSIRPAVPVYCRWTPTDSVPFFRSPVSSMTSIAS